MVYFLYASDWLYALGAICSVLIKVSLEGMMKGSLKVESQTHQKLKAPTVQVGLYESRIKTIVSSLPVPVKYKKERVKC